MYFITLLWDQLEGHIPLNSQTCAFTARTLTHDPFPVRSFDFERSHCIFIGPIHHHLSISMHANISYLHDYSVIQGDVPKYQYANILELV